MGPKSIVVATHGHCFDGMASAAVFTRLMRGIGDAKASFRYISCGYGPKLGALPDAWLDGDDNAILDFRFTPSPRVTWYFDHHVTAFSSPEERAAAERAGTRIYYDASYGSCTKLVADVAQRDFDVDVSDMSKLVSWADVIDSARFSSAEDAIRRDDPVLQLASVVEHHGDTPFLGWIVPKLVEQPLDEVASSSEVQAEWAQLQPAYEAHTARVRASSKLIGRVAFVDLAAAPVEASGKFVTYALYPTCVYSVMISRGKQQLKVSVGYNPWCGVPRTHDVAAICRRYGGGGHPTVGAFSLPPTAIDAAHQAAEAIVRELNDGAPSVPAGGLPAGP